ncbi:hypothetical protein AnigIFM63309_011540 [Aspergillus niger]|nr:hypothetical protein AnigIFM63309_011540 [Aspergillus niger]
MTPITGDGDPPSPTKSSLTQRFFSSIGNKIKGFFMRRKPGFMGTISMYLVEKLFAFTRKLTQHSVPSSKPQEVIKNPQTEEDFKKNVDFLVKQSNLSGYASQLNDSYLREVAKKAVQLKNDPKNHLNNPDQITTLTQLALYQPALQELVKRIISVATRAVPDNPESPGEKLEGASLKFMNMDNEYTIRKLEDLSQVVFEATGGTPLGTKLHDRVLKPLIYDVLGTQKMLPRPLLIFTITDGLPDDDDMTVQEGITNCMKYLTDREQPKEVVSFAISQVGDDENARKFLDSLNNDNKVRDVLHCTTELLDKRFEELRANERDLETWLLEMLSKQIRIKKPASS